jgi:fatty acid desaturase
VQVAIDPRISAPVGHSSDAERFRAFGRAIDEIHADVRAKVGQDDLRYIRNFERFSRTMEASGRLLLALGPGPLSFGLGVAALWVHKQLQVSEIGHTILHGAFNKIEGAERFHSSTWNWRMPIEEKGWIHGHNGAHHGLTNVVGDDPDVQYGPVRLTADVPHRNCHYLQLPFMLFILIPNFGFLMNLHFTGLSDIYRGATKPTRAEWRARHRQALSKYLPYYARETLLFPALAWALLGPWAALRMAAGNFLAERLRDIYSAVTIFCGHVGGDTAHFPTDTRPSCKGERHAMQVEASNNFRVPRVLSYLCGALDLQIEHHLFPTLPTQRLRQVAPAVRAACEAHGVAYREESWPRAIWKAAVHVARLSVPQAHERIDATAPSDPLPVPTRP